jgi:hypothetical protein
MITVTFLLSILTMPQAINDLAAGEFVVRERALSKLDAYGVPRRLSVNSGTLAGSCLEHGRLVEWAAFARPQP